MKEWVCKVIKGALEDELHCGGGAIESASVETHRGRLHISCSVICNNRAWFKAQGGHPELYFTRGEYRLVVSPSTEELLWMGANGFTSISSQEWEERYKKIEGKHLISLVNFNPLIN